MKGFAHITGGGLTDNIPRVLPDGLEVVLQRRSWARDPVFDWLAATGRIAAAEMYRTFNCGIGMVAVVAPADVDAALASLQASGERPASSARSRAARAASSSRNERRLPRRGGHLRPRQQHGSHRARRAAPRQRATA